MPSYFAHLFSISGFTITFFILQLTSTQNSEGSLLTCACNTQECRSQGSNRCIATNMCFVQYNPAGRLNRRKTEPVRGCINRSTPLLCENRPPTLMGNDQPAWPILHCCSSQMCNRNIIPTSPPWLGPAVPLKKNDSTLKATMEESEIVPADPILSESDDSTISDPASDEAANPIQTILSQSSRVLTVEKVINVSDPVEPGPFNSNLLYIIISALAVLFLMLFLALAVVALRKRSEYLSTEDLVNTPSKKAFHSRHSVKSICVEEEDSRGVLPQVYLNYQIRHI